MGNPFDEGDVTAEVAAEVEKTEARFQGSGLTGGMIKTQTEYQSAITVTKPRELKAVERRVLEEAARMGTDFIYRWRQKTKDKRLDEGDGKTTIEGMSIDGAMVLARNWGNCALPVRLDQETETHFLIRADFIDLETGFSFPRLYRQRKTGGPGGKMEEDRKEDIAFQIGQSKAQRNVVDKALPYWLKDNAIQAAKSAAAKKYKDTAKWTPKVVATFQGLGVDVARLVARMRKPTDQWTPYDLLTLEIIYRTIKDGESTVGEEFPVAGGAEGPGETTSAAKAAEEALRARGAQASQGEPPKPDETLARDWDGEAVSFVDALTTATGPALGEVRARFVAWSKEAPSEIVESTEQLVATALEKQDHQKGKTR